MSLKERFVSCDIFDTYNVVSTNLNHFVNQLERIAAVSYTHLDVYKRQQLRSAKLIGI